MISYTETLSYILCHEHQQLAGEANFVPGCQRGVRYLVDDHQYLYFSRHASHGHPTRKEGDVGRFWWRCIEEHSGCPGAFFTEVTEEDGKLVERLEGKGKQEHNHASDPAKVGASKLPALMISVIDIWISLMIMALPKET